MSDILLKVCKETKKIHQFCNKFCKETEMISCACGTSFSISHALSSPKGGFPSIRHNEIRDLTVGFLTEVCNDVKIELELQPISGEALSRTTSNNADSARLDIAVNGFWGERHERTFQDKRVFNPHASSNRTSSSCVKHEKERESLKTASMRGGAHFIYSDCLVSNRRYGQTSHNIL